MAACRSDVPQADQPAFVAQLAAPPEHGGVLLVPPAGQLASRIALNSVKLNELRFSLLDQDIQSVRRDLREKITADTDAPIVATGHQPDFIHAGVWAKHIVAHRSR
jgi:hypothetical protein